MGRRPRDLYELWDFETRNLLGAYDNENEALSVVRAMIDEHGPDAVCQWGLGHDRRGKLVSLIEGAALIDRARAEDSVAATNR